MRITINIEDNRVPFFMELIRNFSFIKVQKETSTKKILADIEQGLKEVEQVEKGKLKSRSAKTFFNEL